MLLSGLQRALLLLGLSACISEVRFDEPVGGGPSSTASTGGASTSLTSSSTSASSTSASSTGAGGETAQDAAVLVAEQCPDIAAEKHFCVTLNYPNQLFALGPDTGNVCHLGDIDGLMSADASSIAVVGPYVHGCTHDEGIWRVNVLGGSAEVLEVSCEAVTAYQGGFLLLRGPSPQGIEVHPTFESMAAEPIEILSLGGAFTRMATRGDTLYGAWHSTNELERHFLPTQESMGTLQLAGFDDWVQGLSATEDGRVYVLSSGTFESPILGFDAETGAELQVLAAADMNFSALHCWSN